MKRSEKRYKHKQFDPEIMAELLDEPGVREHVERMTPGELELYKKLLVSQGIYSQYVKEQKRILEKGGKNNARI